MGTENTSSANTRAGSANVAAGDSITASRYQAMINVLEDLISHSHTFYDDYTTVCECQCQCDCSRGTL
jgi:hypothetical protein